MTENENGYVNYSVQDYVGTIEFFHPKGNSLPGYILKKLSETIIKSGNHPESRVIVLKSGGEGAFCAGASFDELTAISTEEDGKKFFMGFANVINAMRTNPKMIISRVHGKTVGGGIGIVAASDFSIAHKDAAVKLSELSLGIGPFVVGPAVRRKLDVSAFSTLALDARNWYDSQWALQHGLFNKVVESVEALNQAVDNLSNDLASSNPQALAELKEIIWHGAGHWDSTLEQRAEISGRLVLSKFTKEMIENFKKG